ncbi:hypothetical protein [Cellulosilyticum ruminicola]|uniref:hypothetical protein n=1 Tax=Cellulosilyticum ruminicola TaxID=425254 RepID=UPI0006CF73B3|nr:hypothetical protein [Cellulosilyticum ruminicola]
MSKENNNWLVKLDYGSKKKLTTRKSKKEAQTMVFINTKVKNIDYEKEVIFHYRDSNSNEWKRHAAKFKKMINDEEEIWSDILKFKGEYVEYAIQYEVGGNTYWDNNGGKNYKTYKDGATIK